MPCHWKLQQTFEARKFYLSISVFCSDLHDNIAAIKTGFALRCTEHLWNHAQHRRTGVGLKVCPALAIYTSVSNETVIFLCENFLKICTVWDRSKCARYTRLKKFAVFAKNIIIFAKMVDKKRRSMWFSSDIFQKWTKVFSFQPYPPNSRSYS